MFASELKALLDPAGAARARPAPPSTTTSRTRTCPPIAASSGACRSFPRVTGCAGGTAPSRSSATGRSTSGRRPALREEEWAERVEDALRRSVRLRLRSDVPLGVFLSGGVDSSSITALAAQELGAAVKTFSIGFRDADFDELRYRAAGGRALSHRTPRAGSSRTGTSRCSAPSPTTSTSPSEIPPPCRPTGLPRSAQTRDGLPLRRRGRRGLRRVQSLPRGPRLRPPGRLAGRRPALHQRRAPRRHAPGSLGPRLRRALRPFRRRSLLLQLSEFPAEERRALLAEHGPDLVSEGPRCFEAYLEQPADGLVGRPAAHRSTHLPSRRHPGEGRPYFDAELAGGACPVPRSPPGRARSTALRPP